MGVVALAKHGSACVPRNTKYIVVRHDCVDWRPVAGFGGSLYCTVYGEMVRSLHDRRTGYLVKYKIY